MKEKFLQFFTGKMSKSVYIAIASAVVCGAVVITSTVIVHNNNQKIDSVLEGLSASENVSELSSESLTESISASENINTQQNANGEPTGDKALQYLAEYDKLTNEYQKKREKLLSDNQNLLSILTTDYHLQKAQVTGTASKDISLQAELDAEYESRKRELESQESKAQEVQKQIDALDSQYEKDVEALKTRYGI